MIRLALAALVAGCATKSAPTPDASVECQFVATIYWSSQDTPEVSAVSIGGVPIDDGVPLSIDQRFDSYDAGRLAPPATVAVTTALGTSSYPLMLGQCSQNVLSTSAAATS